MYDEIISFSHYTYKSFLNHQFQSIYQYLYGLTSNIIKYQIQARLENPTVAKGLRLYSARSFANRTRTFVAKTKKVTTAKKTEAVAAKKEKVFGKNKQARVITAKAPKFSASIPAEIRAVANKKVNTKVALRKSITPGTVLIILAGRFAGKRVVFLNQLASGLLLVTGPFKVNGVPLRRIDQRYVIATSTKVDVSGVKVAESINDAYFNVEKKSTKKSEDAFFKDEKKVEKKKIADSRVADQKSVDASILAALKKDKTLTIYLKTKFFLKKGEYPHQLKF
ncbi:hypothetical protein DICPUDRAFT_97654 [Dictyostelium purpureum]|uniref:60S ribosomal protein L6 n=1 Tax=Dictyostelium purpureum TaxID=5786 RepID=F0ZIL6_DICPU|nr:uncharacterized protein DICPUDRAFT_97654 [Dictyostelium purpureum]EGC36210.1 hypothetical protein DICPUDRAFT_97654 [Dictyostelium purpureum]|eukprot:XP_003287277.1 hypothetical protein DICPUDRAFT_97654 [Dictyostelium purpureum]